MRWLRLMQQTRPRLTRASHTRFVIWHGKRRINVLTLDEARAVALLARRQGKHVTVYGVTERGRLSLISD
jgi:hypothetical protein